MPRDRIFVIGTRKSSLAMWQATHVERLLIAARPETRIQIKHFTTKGDISQNEDKPLPIIGGKGLFTSELEQAMLKKEIDFAVHSLKDLPTQFDPSFVLGAICKRGTVSDVMVSRSGASFSDLPQGATIGTSSARRSAQLKHRRPDLLTSSIRGNLETRLAKLASGKLGFDAIVLAQAGLERLGLAQEISYIFTEDEMLPAPGQGAIAVQCRAGDEQTLEILQSIDHQLTRAEVTTERAFLNALGAGCNTPVACRTRAENGRLYFRGRCLSPDGSRAIETNGSAELKESSSLGRQMAADVLSRGYEKLKAEAPL